MKKNILRLGLPKGSLQESTFRMFQKAGFNVSSSDRSYFPAIDDNEIEPVLFRAQEMSRYVEEGIVDCGITGNDWVIENGSDVAKVSELIYAKQGLRPVKWVLAVPNNSKIRSVKQLKGKRIATELVNGTKKYLKKKKVSAEVEFSWGATEIKPGAGFVDEAMFNSACFYKYFSIDWDQLVKNLSGFTGIVEHLAAHTVGAFLKGASFINPTGKQNSYAAHNLPDGILIEIKDRTPVSYVNAFVKPVEREKSDIVERSIANMAAYENDLDLGYGKPRERFWFSPGLRYPLKVSTGNEEFPLTPNNLSSFDELITKMISVMGYNWEEVQQVAINQETSA